MVPFLSHVFIPLTELKDMFFTLMGPALYHKLNKRCRGGATIQKACAFLKCKQRCFPCSTTRTCVLLASSFPKSKIESNWTQNMYVGTLPAPWVLSPLFLCLSFRSTMPHRHTCFEDFEVFFDMALSGWSYSYSEYLTTLVSAHGIKSPKYTTLNFSSLFHFLHKQAK